MQDGGTPLVLARALALTKKRASHEADAIYAHRSLHPLRTGTGHMSKSWLEGVRRHTAGDMVSSKGQGGGV